MEKLTFNTENWSGESVTLEIEAETFTIFGYRFTLRFRVHEDKIQMFEALCPEWKEPVVRGYFLEGVWVAHSTQMPDFYREHESPFVATGKVLCNIL